MGAISVPVHLRADGNSKICFSATGEEGNGASALCLGLCISIPITELIDALAA